MVNPNDFSSLSELELEEILEDISWSAPSSGLGCDGSSMKTETLRRDGSKINRRLSQMHTRLSDMEVVTTFSKISEQSLEYLSLKSFQ